MKTEIVRPTRENEDEIRRLLTVTIRHTFVAEGVDVSHVEDLEKEVRYQWDSLAQDFETEGRDEYFLSAILHGQIVGVAARGTPNEIISRHMSVDASQSPEIKSVYVLPDYQGRGVGSLLFQSILLKLIEQGVSEFCLDSGYANAQVFWKRKLGDPTVILPDYWCPDGHHMIWKRQINDLKGPFLGE